MITQSWKREDIKFDNLNNTNPTKTNKINEGRGANLKGSGALLREDI
jgi:hypothetical protein